MNFSWADVSSISPVFLFIMLPLNEYSFPLSKLKYETLSIIVIFSPWATVFSPLWFPAFVEIAGKDTVWFSSFKSLCVAINFPSKNKSSNTTISLPATSVESMLYNISTIPSLLSGVNVFSADEPSIFNFSPVDLSMISPTRVYSSPAVRLV